MKTDREFRSAWSVVAALVLAVGCSSGSKPASTPRCTLSSQCSGTNVCALGYCVQACGGSKDCTGGARCVQPDPTVPDSYVCQAPEVSKCEFNSQCATLYCGSDGNCRNECMQTGAQSVDCPFGLNGLHMDCASDPVKMVNLCADPVADSTTYNPTTMMIIPKAGSGGATGSGGGGASGAAGKSGTGGKGGSGAGGIPMSGCTSPQTAFGNTAQGDSNASFTAGVGTSVADRLLLFTTYSGPPVALPAGGASGTLGAGGAGGAPATANYIFAQSFDPASGAALGAASPLFQVADGTNLYLHNIAVSSQGEVVLLHGTGPANTNNTQLYASFLTTTAGGIQFERTVLIESIQFGDVNAVWSEANQQFVLSWENSTNGWQLRIKKFRSGGIPAGGDTNAVATPSGLNGTAYSPGVGVSGQLFAAAYRNYSDGHPYLTLLDATGNMAGAFTEVSKDPIDRWINVGGTTKGFSVLYQKGTMAYEYFIPKTADGTGIQLQSSGAGGAGGAGGAAGVVWPSFAITSTATTEARAFSVSDELGAGGVGTAYLENNGASFLYVSADGAKHYPVGAVISSSAGAQVAITNYRGSFAVSLFDGTKHAAQVVASGCTQ